MTTPVLLILALAAVFAAALLARRNRTPKSGQPRQSSEPVLPRVPPLEPGERYDTSVKLAMVPNVPLADLWCQRLREEGIEAYYQSAAVAPAFVGEGGPRWNPGLPVEVWVGEHDLERARELFPELK